MKYIIDSANFSQIQTAMEMGVTGITANPTLYAKNQQAFYPFLRTCSQLNPSFLSGEVMSSALQEMQDEAKNILEINPKIVIKINFSLEGLKLCHALKQQGYSCAITLIFHTVQAIAAINAGADYLFPFVGRTDEYGDDGLKMVAAIQQMVIQKQYPVRVVAASIKNLHQLEALAAANVDFAAIPYELLMKSLSHPLTEKGAADFLADWETLSMS